MADQFCPDNIKKQTGLASVLVYNQLDSTNARAAELVESGQLKTPAAIIALDQTCGRGQGSNTWWSDRGSLTVTFALSRNDRSATAALPLRVGLAVRSALAAYIPIQQIQLKWPNDVLVGGKKISGILCRQILDTALIGVGLNVHTNLPGAPADIRRRAVSLHEITSAAPRRQGLFIRLYHALGQALDEPNWLHQFHQCDALRDSTIAVDIGAQTIRGKCLGVDEHGRLLVEEKGKQHAIISGQILRQIMVH